MLSALRRRASAIRKVAPCCDVIVSSPERHHLDRALGQQIIFSAISGCGATPSII
jgi:hypothetical protein